MLLGWNIGMFGITANSVARFILILSFAYSSFDLLLLTVQHDDKILKMELLSLHGNHPDLWLWALPKISCGFSTYLLSGIMNLVHNSKAQRVIGDEWLNFSAFIYSWEMP